MNDKLLSLLEKEIEQSEEKSSLQFGSSGERFKIYFDSSDPRQMKEKIENQLGAIEFIKEIQESGEGHEMLEKFLKRAKGDDTDE